MRANVFRYTPESGLKSDIARGPVRANNRLYALQQDALDFGFALAAMAAGSVQ